jgi:hypothetical protein
VGESFNLKNRIEIYVKFGSHPVDLALTAQTAFVTNGNESREMLQAT